MPKRPNKLHFRLPPYVSSNRNKWRRLIHKAAREKQAGVLYAPDDKLDIEVDLYLAGRALSWHDVDNRLKDVLDALQGRFGGSKKARGRSPIIPNDRLFVRNFFAFCEDLRGM